MHRIILRASLALLLIPLFASLAPAQLYRVHFKDPKAARRLKRGTLEFQGELVLIGEPKKGLTITPGNINYTGGAKAENEFWVANPADPLAVPYEIEEGERKVADSKGVISIAGNDIKAIRVHDRSQSLQGLASEYIYRTEGIEALEEQRDEQKKGSAEWFALHSKLLEETRKLQSWLHATSFPEAAERLDRQIGKESKAVAKEAAAERRVLALHSAHPVEVPECLDKLIEDLTGGASKLSMQESTHIRLIYTQALDDDRVADLLQLGEEVIDGFRLSHVDPYLGEDFPDQIPDDICLEFFWGPDDASVYERALEQCYRTQWGKNKDRMLQGTASWHHIQGPPFRILNYARFDADREQDIDSRVVHGVGHMLSTFHLGGGNGGGRLAFLQEGVAYYVGLEYLGRNSSNCFAYKTNSYAEKAEKEVEKSVRLGMRPELLLEAIDKGRIVDTVVIKDLADFDDFDISKSWAFVDYVMRTLGKDGQKWLRESARAARNDKTFMAEWRSLTEKYFPVAPGEDVFKKIEGLWKEHAREDLKDASRTKTR